MALGYELTVTDSKGTEIKLTSMDGQHGGREDIICASYKSNTLNDDSIARCKSRNQDYWQNYSGKQGYNL